MSEKTIRKIRKVVTHVSTGRQWATPGVPYTEALDNDYFEWLKRRMDADCAFTIPTGLNDTHHRHTSFNPEILKQCVVEVEIYEDRDE